MNCSNCRMRLAASLLVATLFAASLTTHTSASASSQQAPRPKQQHPTQGKPESAESQRDDQEAIRLGTDLVMLDVTVVDPGNKPVMDLNKESFAVTEEKLPQKIEFFSRDQVPVSLVFTIDTSGSMRPKLDTVIQASTNLARASKRGDELAVIEFKDIPELLEEFTNNVEDVVDTLRGLVASRQTALLDALYLAADYASKEGKNRRKAVVLVTDGLDRDSFYKFGEVVDHLRETEAQIFLIGFTGDLDRDTGLFHRGEKGKAESLLSKLAEETGGKAFFPKDLAETQSIAEEISTALRTQYSIGYYPTNSKKDGTFRQIRVVVNSGNRRLIARTRNGRTAPKEIDHPGSHNQ